MSGDYESEGTHLFDGGCFQDCTNARHVLQNRDSGWQEVAAHDVEVALSRREKNAKMQAGDSTPEESEEAVAFNKHADDCVADEHNSEAEEEAHGALSMRRQDPLGYVGGEKDISGQYAERERSARGRFDAWRRNALRPLGQRTEQRPRGRASTKKIAYDEKTDTLGSEDLSNVPQKEGSASRTLPSASRARSNSRSTPRIRSATPPAVNATPIRLLSELAIVVLLVAYSRDIQYL